MRKIFLPILIMCSVLSHATNYYVSNNGNDQDNGKTPERAFASIDRVNQLRLRPGDKVLFERGGIFTGGIILMNSGKPDKPIVISSYGDTSLSKPLISGSIAISEWKEEKEGLYSAHVSSRVKHLYSGDQYLQQARLPNKGYFFMDQDGNREILIDKELEHVDNLNGSTIRVQTVNWQWEIRKIKSKDGATVTFDSLLWHPTKKDFGYYLEDNLDFVDQHGEWFYDTSSDKLYLMWDGNIKSHNFLAVVNNNGIMLDEGISNIRIENLAIEHFHNAGIKVGQKASRISIMNNRVAQIEVFGVTLDQGCEQCEISNNVIYNVQGRGISTLEPQQCKINKNTIKRIGMIAGHGFDGVNSGVGICMENREFQDPDNQTIAMHNQIAGNRIDSTGYGAIRADGAYNVIEFNVVKDAVLTMNEGAGIYSWGANYDYSHHSIFRNNIVMNVHGNTESCAGHHKIICALYFDNYSNHHVAENNVFVCDETGIILNDLSHSHTVRNNTIYGTKTGISYSVWMKNKLDTTIRGNYHVTKNTIYSKGGESRVINYTNHIQVPYMLGVLDSNIYVSPTAFDLIAKRLNFGTHKITTDYTFGAWQDQMGFDKNSQVIYPPKSSRPWEMEDQSLILVNDETVVKTFDLKEEEYMDLNGQKKTGLLHVRPFEGLILYKQ